MSFPHVHVFIQSRLTSSRLPAKALLPLAGFPTVVLSALRARNKGLNVRVLTSSDSSDNAIEDALKKYDIPCFRGSLDDVLLRFAEAAKDLDDHDLIIRLTADNVFPDGDFLNLLVNEFKQQDIDYLGTNSPEDGLPYGLSAEIFKVACLRRAQQHATDSFDREHVTPYIKRNFSCQNFIYREGMSDWPELRCTLDVLSDYILLLEVFREVLTPIEIHWQDLVKQLKARSN